MIFLNLCSAHRRKWTNCLARMSPSPPHFKLLFFSLHLTVVETHSRKCVVLPPRTVRACK